MLDIHYREGFPSSMKNAPVVSYVYDPAVSPTISIATMRVSKAAGSQ